jgi:hypothetical protein
MEVILLRKIYKGTCRRKWSYYCCRMKKERSLNGTHIKWKGAISDIPWVGSITGIYNGNYKAMLATFN